MRASKVREEIDRALGEAPLVVHRLADECAKQSGLRDGLLVWLAGEAVSTAPRLHGDEACLGRAAAAMELLAWFIRLHGEVPPASGIGPLEQLLAGDFFYAKSLSLAAELPREVTLLYTELACSLTKERLRLRERSRGPSRSMREELEQAFAKSGRWMATSCRIGALLGRGGAPVEEALTSYGFALGMAWHLDRTPTPRREDIRPLIASYRKRASSHLSALPESEAKLLLLQAPDGLPCLTEKRRAMLNV
ncbi:hypothetical protein [Tumebacillus permanentifrigoris]|nr:hypothetical protein [Tumebacillus permanentifrigoris]